MTSLNKREWANHSMQRQNQVDPEDKSAEDDTKLEDLDQEDTMFDNRVVLPNRGKIMTEKPM